MEDLLKTKDWRIVNESWGTIYRQDCRFILPSLPSDTYDSLVTDPPAGIDFMGKDWDNPDKYGEDLPAAQERHIQQRQGFVSFMESVMKECFRVLKPGAHGVVWALPRTSHWTATALENVGFEVRDCIYHIKPRSPEVSAFLSSLTLEQWELLERCKPTDEFLLHIFGCLSEDTEILTEEGWVLYQKCVVGKRVMCYDSVHDTFSWQPIEGVFVYPYQDTAYRLRGDHTDQIVSRNHRCLVERGGKTVFQYAETLGCQETVPVLADLPSLLEALPLPHSASSTAYQDVCRVRSASCSCEAQQGHQDSTKGDGDLLSLRQGEADTAEGNAIQRAELLQPFMSCEDTGRRTGHGNDRIARPFRMDSGESRLLSRENVGATESCMEGRSDVYIEARELRVGAVCSLPAGVPFNGSERRVCDGTSASSGPIDGAVPYEAGSGTSYQPRSNGQPNREPDGLCVESGSQAVRASRFTRSDMVRVEPIPYDGIVWCVKTPTGAFVARRAGKAFVTGNSGFPKSLDVSKAIDKMAGAVREARVNERWVGKYPEGPGGGHTETFGQVKNISGNPIMTSDPVTDEAKLWSGWGTALKPAVEVWWVVRKPIREANVATQVRKTGTGAINIDGCRVAGVAEKPGGKIRAYRRTESTTSVGLRENEVNAEMVDAPDPHPGGRWPSHLLISHVKHEWYAIRSDVPEAVVQAIHSYYGVDQALRTLRGRNTGDALRASTSTLLRPGVCWVEPEVSTQEGMGQHSVPGVRNVVRGDSGLGAERAPEVLLKCVPTQGEFSDSQRSSGHASFSRVSGENVRCSETASESRETPNVEGGPLCGQGVCTCHDSSSSSGRSDTCTTDVPTRIHSGASFGDGSETWSPPVQGGACSPSQRDQDGQSPGESRTGEVERAQQNASGSGSGSSSSSRREPRLEVQSWSIPRGWRQYFVLVRVTGCRRNGTKTVATGRGDTPIIGASVGYEGQSLGKDSRKAGTRCITHRSEDGTETIENWECAPECPSNMLNQQSGVTTSGAMKNEVPAYEGESNTGFLRGRSGPSNQHGDSGGASRFFQTFEHESEAWECAPDCPSKILNDQSGELTSGALDRSRIRAENNIYGQAPKKLEGIYTSNSGGASRFFQTFESESEKWECVPECPSKILDEQSGERPSTLTGRADPNESHAHPASARPDAFFGTIQGGIGQVYADSGGASRFFKSIEHEPPFFYAAKASRSERDEGLGSRQAKAMHGLKEAKISTQSNRKCKLCGRVKFGQPHCECPAPEWAETSGSMSKNSHPTVKSIKLMTYLVRLVTPKGGVVLDPFSGSGSTLVAALKEGARFVGIEREEEYALIAEERVRYTASQELEMQEALATFDLLSELEQEM